MKQEVIGRLAETRSIQAHLPVQSQNKIIVFEGPDNSGKTTIAKHVSEIADIPYYKNPRERMLKAKGEIGLVTKYAGLWFADFLQQVPISVIVDRHYISEWVYTLVEERERDEDLLREMDILFEKAGAYIIICTKQVYEGYTDELTPNNLLLPLAKMYQEFAHWSVNKRILYIDTTDQDLDTQCEKIKNFIQTR